MVQRPVKSLGWTAMGEVLTRSLKDIPKTPEDEKDWLSISWDVVVGSKLASVSRLEKVAPQTLFVTLAQSEWKPALKSIENRILSSLNQQAGRPRFSRIVYKIANPGSWPVHVSETKPTVKRPIKNKGNFSVEPTLEHIKDKDLLATLQRITRRLNMMLVLLGATVLLSNCTTMQNSASREKVDLKDSYAVKQIKVLKQKHPEWKLNDPRGYYHFLMGLKFHREGDFDAARDHFKAVAEVDPSNEEFQGRWIELALRTGHMDEALEGGLKALERFPKNIQIRAAIADILAATGRQKEAIEHYKKLIVLDNKTSRGRLMLAHTLESMGKYREAFDYYEKALEIEASNPLTYYFYGRALTRNGQHDRAIEKLEKALSLRPSLQDARETLAFSLEKKKEYSKANEHYQILMKLRPGSKVIVDHLKELEPFVRGNGVGDLKPMELRDVDIHLQIGAIMYEQAVYHEAIDEFRLVLAKEEKRDLRLLIARIYEMFGRMDKATQEIETYRRVSGEPDTVDILLNLARLYGLDEKMEQSVRLLKRAVAMQPQNDRLFHSLALAQMSVKENDQAIQSIQKAIELDGQKDAYFFELGALYERVGDYQRAIQAMEQTLAINPNHSNAHNFIGYLYAVEGVKLEKALDHLKIALTIQPRNGYFLDSLGWIYYKKGDLDEALKHIKKAMIYTSPDPVLYDHLGDVHYSLKNFSEAHRAWQTSLSLTMKKINDPTGELPDPAELKNKIEKTRQFMGSDL